MILTTFWETRGPLVVNGHDHRIATSADELASSEIWLSHFLYATSERSRFDYIHYSVMKYSLIYVPQ